MRHSMSLQFLLPLFLLTAGAAAGKTREASVEESNRKFAEPMKAMSAFVEDVRFDEGDIKAVIAHWKEINALGDESARDKKEGEMIDFEEILAYPAYRSWAESKGLDPDRWMKKFMRIQLMLVKGSTAATASEGNARLKAQLLEIEAQRAQLGEEMYRQVVQAIKMGATTVDSIDTAYEEIPEPTPEEKALLDKYRDRLMNLR